MEALITEIERFALNDGPGIRTTVFFKGCNMRCRWCHNPETIKSSRELLYYESKCIGCYKCVYSCPSKAQKRINNIHVFYPNICVRCGKCADLCFAGAMVMCCKKYTVDDVMSQIIQDKAYYISSGGGVTLSGGEVLCQCEFAGELTRACHDEGIPVAIETNLNFPWKSISGFIESVDLIMCDIKLIDSIKHKNETGVGNETILENVLHIAKMNKPFIVRTPLIPGVTDNEDNIAGIAEFLRKTDVDGSMLYYELLNFNSLGEAKYAALSAKNDFANVKPLEKSRVLELLSIAKAVGLKTKIG